MALVRVFLNGNEVQVEQGVTILEAARSHGFDIPTLCDDEQLEPFTSCWACVVRLEGLTRYVPACATKVAGGMKIWTDGEDVRAVRRMALELLLSNHRGDCIAPCKAACPAGVDVQGYIALVAQGQHREAVKLIKSVNPFPLAIGRVCTRPCEAECRRNAVDGPVGIDYLKRYAADWDASHPNPYVPPAAASTGKSVAMVGAGPGSLTAGYYLAQKGHAVTAFEALPGPGGMLRYGIPEYRLPKTVLDEDVRLILETGVELRCDSALGRDFTIGELFDRGYGAVFLGMGAMGSRKMQVPGEDLEGVWAGTEFLKEMGLGTSVSVGRRVAVIGGGNTAIDAARTCLRLGSEKVTVVYRRSRSEMPAWDVEVEGALEEGIEMHFLAAPTAITGDGRCESMECIRMELGEPDASGRRRPVPLEGSEFLIEVDNVIAAIGQVPDLSAIRDTAERDPDSLEAKLDLTRWGTIVADDSGATSVPGVFAGGDVVTGAATAIEAIAAGGAAAEAIDRYLAGERAEARRFFNIQKERWDTFPEEELASAERKPRQEMPELPVKERVKTFEEVELGYTEEQALEEATRCLECGCQAGFTCELRRYAAEYDASVDRFDGEVSRRPVDERHPYLTLEPEKCIMCARCIRICEDVQGAAALGFFRRGFSAEMRPSLDRPLVLTECESCGQCVTTCPTAAVRAKVDLPKAGPWASEMTVSTCASCGTGCSISLETVGGALVAVTPASQSRGYERNLCVRGRFGTGFGEGRDRLLEPLVKDRGDLVPATLDRAAAAVAGGLGAVVREHGGQSVAVFGSPRLTNEEAYWLQKLGRLGLSTPNVGSFGLALESAVFSALRSTLGYAASTASYEDVGAADVVLLLDSDIAEEQTVAGIGVRKAVQRGARLVVVSPSETRMSRMAAEWIRASRNELDDVLGIMIDHVLAEGLADPNALSGGIDGLDALRDEVVSRSAERSAASQARRAEAAIAAARDFAGAGRAVLIANALAFDPEAAERDASLAVSLAILCGKATARGSGVLFLRMRANGQGLADVGLDPHCLPGHLPLSSDDARRRLESVYGRAIPSPPVADCLGLYEALEAGAIRGALIVGEDPIAGADDPERVRRSLKGLEFLAVADTVSSLTTEVADVVLPLNAPTETDGTFTNSERRIQPVRGPLSRPGSMSNLAMLARLAESVGIELGDPDARAVMSEIVLVAEALGPSEAAKPGGGYRWGGDVLFTGELATAGGRPRLRIPKERRPQVVFDPRWTDALEVRFARHAQDVGLSPHVVRRYGVCA